MGEISYVLLLSLKLYELWNSYEEFSRSLERPEKVWEHVTHVSVSFGIKRIGLVLILKVAISYDQVS